MVYYATTNQLNQAYGHMIGVHDAVNTLLRPDSDNALALANLRPSQSVLKISAGSSQLITMAKGKIDNGFCVTVDAVQGFIATNIP